MTTTKLPSETQGRPAFDALAHELASIPEAAIVRPHADPRAAAMTALLVADASGASELRKMARAVLMVLNVLGGDYLPEDATIAPELLAHGRDVRRSAVEALEAELAAVLSQGDDAVDLAYALRTLAMMTSPSALLVRAADAIEIALRASESAEQEDARAAVGRLWTLLVPEYDRVRAASGDATFPPLALVAGTQRMRRRGPQPEPPRRGLELEACVTDDGRVSVGFTENVSAGGMFVATYVRHAIDSRIAIALKLPDGRVQPVTGIVRWVREPAAEQWPGIGVEVEQPMLLDL